MALVERERETTVLRNSLINCVHGEGAAVLVTGGVGSGKTALLRNLARQVRQTGALLLGAIGSPTERNREFGLLDQLLRHASRPGEVRSRPCRPDESGDVAPVHDLCSTLLDWAGDRPLVITVDDIQFADAASLEVLLALHRRIGPRRVLLIFTVWTGLPHERLEAQAELSRSPQFHYIRLPMLSISGVAALLAQCTGTAVTGAQAAAGHHITGGNPLLVRALAEDNMRLTDHRELHTGAAFGRAVSTCLLRSDSRLVGVARGCAVLEGPASPDLVARVVGLDRRRVASCMDLLMAGGLLLHHDFRSEATRTAVLDCMPAAERVRLRWRAAEVLYRAGAGAHDVAKHVLAAGRPAAGWQHDMLREAAEHALAGGDSATATEFLELSWRTDQDVRRRTQLVPLLAQALWRADPAAAVRYLLRRELCSPIEVTKGSISVLTAAERRVATLAARGCTNSEIADRLQITISTVEQHLTKTYRKLKVTRRTELLAVLPAAPLGQSEPVELHSAASVRADRKPA
ncbi:MAG: AAA family ATPase [Pseudonocardiaceae bacterium]